MTDRQHQMLSSLTTAAACIPSLVTTEQSSTVSTSACIAALNDLLGGNEEISVLDFDAFSAMVSVVYMLPTVFSTSHATAKGGLQDQYVMQLCFLVHILQVLLTYDDLESFSDPDIMENDVEEQTEEMMDVDLDFVVS